VKVLIAENDVVGAGDVFCAEDVGAGFGGGREEEDRDRVVLALEPANIDPVEAVGVLAGAAVGTSDADGYGPAAGCQQDVPLTRANPEREAQAAGEAALEDVLEEAGCGTERGRWRAGEVSDCLGGGECAGLAALLQPGLSRGNPLLVLGLANEGK